MNFRGFFEQVRRAEVMAPLSDKTGCIYHVVPPGQNVRCPVCLLGVRHGGVAIHKCGHVFHGRCIEMWFGRDRSCPMCRTRVPSGRVEYAEDDGDNTDEEEY